MESRYNTRSPAVKRLMREAQELSQPTDQYFAQPLEDNLFEWHFTIRGPSDSDFQNGIYHGRIILPVDYPMKPPSIIWLTPNGRFETNKKICLSISGHHPESWQPSWSIRTALLAIIGFMPTHPNGAIGSLDYTPDERKILAKRSVDWKCPVCGDISNFLKEPDGESIITEKEAKELATQINFQVEKPKNDLGISTLPSNTACSTTAQNHPTSQQISPFYSACSGLNPSINREADCTGRLASVPRFPYPPSYYSQCGYSFCRTSCTLPPCSVYQRVPPSFESSCSFTSFPYRPYLASTNICHNTTDASVLTCEHSVDAAVQTQNRRSEASASNSPPPEDEEDSFVQSEKSLKNEKRTTPVRKQAANEAEAKKRISEESKKVESRRSSGADSKSAQKEQEPRRSFETDFKKISKEAESSRSSGSESKKSGNSELESRKDNNKLKRNANQNNTSMTDTDISLSEEQRASAAGSDSPCLRSSVETILSNGKKLLNAGNEISEKESLLGTHDTEAESHKVEEDNSETDIPQIEFSDTEQRSVFEKSTSSSLPNLKKARQTPVKGLRHRQSAPGQAVSDINEEDQSSASVEHGSARVRMEAASGDNAQNHRTTPQGIRIVQLGRRQQQDRQQQGYFSMDTTLVLMVVLSVATFLILMNRIVHMIDWSDIYMDL